MRDRYPRNIPIYAIINVLISSFIIIKSSIFFMKLTYLLSPMASLIIVLTCFPLPLQAVDALDKSRATVATTNKQLQQKQKKIDGLHEQTSQMVDQYRSALREIESYEIYNKQLKAIVLSQGNDLISLQQQIIEIEVTAQQIMPMMQRMIDTLQQFVAQDIPFLPVERAERLTRLEDTMKRADISVAEKYRKILEAYQIEIEYGKTLEAYRALLGDKNVNFLKVGRVAFFYETLDAQSYGVWQPKLQTWQLVEDREVKKSIATGIKIARKQRSPELLTIMATTAEDTQ